MLWFNCIFQRNQKKTSCEINFRINNKNTWCLLVKIVVFLHWIIKQFIYTYKHLQLYDLASLRLDKDIEFHGRAILSDTENDSRGENSSLWWYRGDISLLNDTRGDSPPDNKRQPHLTTFYVVTLYVITQRLCRSVWIRFQWIE